MHPSRIVRSTFALSCLLGVSAQAFDIQLNAGGALSGNAPALAAFERAAMEWEAIFDDPITIILDVDLAALGTNIIGQAQSVMLFGDNFAEIRDAMVADDLAEGGSIVQALPTFGQLSATLPAGRTLFDNMQITKANLKALGFDAGLLQTISGQVEDGTITFSSDFAFDYDSTNGVGFGLIDFQTAAAHEIGHVLGFISVVDDIDFTTSGEYPAIELTPLDLFRFGAGANPTTAAEFTTFARELTPGSTAYFDDLTHEWGFATGVNDGDGTQASHWKDDVQTSTFVGLMDPTLNFGTAYGPTLADITAFDRIGYHVAVPEPGSAVLLALGGLLVLRRRRA